MTAMLDQFKLIQRVVIFDGPDGTGKTSIARALAKSIDVPYFKFGGEADYWRRGQFRTALEFDQPFMLQFLQQTKTELIWDRAYPSEWVYASVFKRETNWNLIKQLDANYAELGAWIVVPLRTSYDDNREDEFVPGYKLKELHNVYEDFCDNFTQCNTLRLYVDTFQDRLDLELAVIKEHVKFGSGRGQVSIIVKG